MSANRWPDRMRLSDIEPDFVCTACGKRGCRSAAEVFGSPHGDSLGVGPAYVPASGSSRWVNSERGSLQCQHRSEIAAPLRIVAKCR